jgi:hypothetical protein
VHISKALETIKDNTNISSGESQCYYELKKHKPWFDEGYSKLLDQRKQAKLQLLKSPSEVINDVKLEGISGTKGGNF